jgi:GR25 family glycosyltransferase involved in LPS biosynthesis
VGRTIKISDIEGGYEEMLYFRKFTSSAAYMINRRSAASLLKYAYPIKFTLDVYLNRNWEFQLNDTLIKPMPVAANEGKSDISAHSGRYVEHKKKLSAKINKMKLRVKTIIARNIYQFIVLLKIKFGGG